MADESSELFSPDEQHDMELKMEKIHREHLIEELLEIRRQTREKIISYLMEINQKVLADRAEDASLVADGQITDSVLSFHDGILAAIAETGEYVARVGDDTNISLAPAAMRAHMAEMGAATENLNLFEGYRILSAYFEI